MTETKAEYYLHSGTPLNRRAEHLWQGPVFLDNSAVTQWQGTYAFIFNKGVCRKEMSSRDDSQTGKPNRMVERTAEWIMREQKL